MTHLLEQSTLKELMRWLYTILGLLLIPACVTVSRTLAVLLTHWLTVADYAPRGVFLAVAGGAGMWLLILLLLPAPLRAYILAHELTHALWGTLMGARLTSIRVSSNKGCVKLTESNFLVALAPYFFPLYTVLILLAYWISTWFIDFNYGRWIWLMLTGLSLGFHFTFTVHALTQQQSDLRGYGLIFPYILIYLFNIAGLLLLTVLLAGIPLPVWTAQLAMDHKIIWNATINGMGSTRDFIAGFLQ